MKRELLLGCGNARDKRLCLKGSDEGWNLLTTLDWDETVNPDVVHDLNICPWPFDDDMFDEVHAYEVLEHIGEQGDWRAFFNQFYEIWRILKPGGMLYATVPMWDSPWAWGDPGHRRVIPRQSLIFLNKREYAQIGKTCITDYRPWWAGDFETCFVQEDEHQMGFVLRARKDGNES